MFKRQVGAKVAKHVRPDLTTKVRPNGGCPAHLKKWGKIAGIEGGQECGLVVPC